MMSNQMYDDFVFRYDSQLFDLVHKYGGLAHVHCHGKVNTIFERMIDMGVDMLDPMEPPPDGDLEIGAAKQRANGRMTLMGNIEIRDLDFATPEEIDDKVRHAINDGGKKYFMLYPTATAISSLTDRYRDNALQYIQSGLEYGAF
jgi:uroporphyrinogen-III decarboxylase